ncbi:MAG TPA: helix-turn-helix domain-containing protein [Pseudonocardia sp.]
MTTYNAVIETARRDEPGDDLLDALADYHPATSKSARGWLTVTITVPADSLRQAITTALALVEQAAGTEVVALEAMTTEEFDARAGFEPMPTDLVGTTEAAQMLGVSRQRVQQMADGGFLPYVRVGGKALAFSRATIMAKRGQMARETI